MGKLSYTALPCKEGNKSPLLVTAVRKRPQHLSSDTDDGPKTRAPAVFQTADLNEDLM